MAGPPECAPPRRNDSIGDATPINGDWLARLALLQGMSIETMQTPKSTSNEIDGNFETMVNFILCI